MNTMRESHSCDCEFCEVVTWEYAVDPGPPDPRGYELPVLQDYITGDMYHVNTRPMVSREWQRASFNRIFQEYYEQPMIEMLNNPSLLWRRLNATASSES